MLWVASRYGMGGVWATCCSCSCWCLAVEAGLLRQDFVRALQSEALEGGKG